MLKVKRIIFSWFLLGCLFFVGNIVSAEPEFGGKVNEIVRCTCGDNAGGVWMDIGDPHGGEYLEKPGRTDVKDCGSPEVEEWVLGMSTEETEDCQIRIYNVCVTVESGEVIDHYGQSKFGGCESGLEGDASGDGKTEMITPDGRTADGGGEDDGGPSGGPSQATKSDTHLATVDGVKADGTVSSGGETDHMETSDGQDYEGGGTSHMVIVSDGNRDYEGNNDTVMTNSGDGGGYSSAGGGRSGHGYGSVGGSVGSGGLQSPVVLGDRDKMEKELKRIKKEELVSDISPGIKGVANNRGMLKMLFIVMSIGGAGYFVFRSMRKVFK